MSQCRPYSQGRLRKRILLLTLLFPALDVLINPVVAFANSIAEPSSLRDEYTQDQVAAARGWPIPVPCNWLLTNFDITRTALACKIASASRRELTGYRDNHGTVA